MKVLDSDRDLRYARGEISREEWIRSRVTSRGFRSSWLVPVVVGVVAIVVVVAFLAASGALLPSGVIDASYGAPARLSPAALGQLNASATLGQAYPSNDTLWFPSGPVIIVIHASPTAHDLTFVVQGLVNPTLHVTAGARVTAIVVNEDPDMYHNWALSHNGPPFSGIPMTGRGMLMESAMLDPPSGGGFWGQQVSLAVGAGQYWYLCSYPGHAADGMYGMFVAG